MIIGLAITPPVIGRISIGQVVEQNGHRLPKKDDQFTLTRQVQNKEGWIIHPLDEQLRQQQQTDKLRTIPVTMLFDDPDLNMRAEYSMFDRKSGRPVCVGNGLNCRRSTQEGIQNLPCPSPTLCEFGKGGLCKAYGRLNVQVDSQKDFGTFIFRTTGFNSIRTLMARMMYYNAVSGGLLSCMPLQLRLRSKSTTMSHRTPIFYVDLEIAEGITLEQAIAQAKQKKQARDEAGFDQKALEHAARDGFANAFFEFTEEDVPEILEEFYPESAPSSEIELQPTPVNQPNQSTNKLKTRLQAVNKTIN